MSRVSRFPRAAFLLHALLFGLVGCFPPAAADLAAPETDELTTLVEREADGNEDCASPLPSANSSRQAAPPAAPASTAIGAIGNDRIASAGLSRVRQSAIAWTEVSAPTDTDLVQQLAFVGDAIFATWQTLDPNNYWISHISRSLDGAQSWSELAVGLDTGSFYDFDVVADATLYLATRNGLLVSTDSGQTFSWSYRWSWDATRIVDFPWTLISNWGSRSGPNLYLPSGQWVDRRGDIPWAHVGLLNTLVVVDDDPNIAYCGSYRTLDAGIHWESMPYKAILTATQGSLPVALSGEHFTTDNGLTWQLHGHAAGVLAHDPNTGRFFANAIYPNTGIYMANELGQPWPEIGLAGTRIAYIVCGQGKLWAIEFDSHHIYHTNIETLTQPDINCEDLTAFNFGTQTVGSCTATHNWTVTNEGTATLTGSIVSSDPNQFPVVTGGGSFSLAAGASRTVGVQFCPSSAGAKSATLAITSNDPDQNPCNIALSGTGSETCHADRNLGVPRDCYVVGDAKTVVIALAPPPAASALAVEDLPPAGWTNISNISNGGSYDAVNHKVKWGPLFPPFPAELSYQITPPIGASGTMCWTGMISIDGVNESVCGNTCIDECPPCPPIAADAPQPVCTGCAGCACATCGDYRVELCEMVGYACAWKRGCNDDLAGMTRAAFLWKNGECYCWNQAQNNWFPAACPGPDTGCCAAFALEQLESGAAAEWATRVTPSSFTPGAPVTVFIALDPTLESKAVALAELVPPGCAVTSISDGGVFDATTRKIKWGPFIGVLPQAVHYTLVVLEDVPEVHLGGDVAADGSEAFISGDRTLPVAE